MLLRIINWRIYLTAKKTMMRGTVIKWFTKKSAWLTTNAKATAIVSILVPVESSTQLDKLSRTNNFLLVTYLLKMLSNDSRHWENGELSIVNAYCAESKEENMSIKNKANHTQNTVFLPRSKILKRTLCHGRLFQKKSMDYFWFQIFTISRSTIPSETKYLLRCLIWTQLSFRI